MKKISPVISRVLVSAIVLTSILLFGCEQSFDNANSVKAPASASDYPPLASTVAEEQFEMIDGTPSKIGDRKGKVVLINLWATWCGYCRVEMPHLIALQNQHRDKGFTVLGLDIGDQNTGNPESVEQITAFAQTMGLNYEIARIQPGLTNKFQKLAQFQGVPQSFLVDREGRLRGVFRGGSGDVIKQMEDIIGRVVAE